MTWSNITLKKGMSSGTALWDWHYGFTAGRGSRRDGVIVLLNDRQVPNNIGISAAVCRSNIPGRRPR